MTPTELWLIWQNPKTRQRYHVGSLLHDKERYVFYYVTKGPRSLTDALNNGYRPHLAFPDVTKVYESTKLFPAFARRLPDRRRPDFMNILQELGLSVDYTVMDLLKATGGRLGTDNYEFVTPIYKENGRFHITFHVAGWRYYDGYKAQQELKEGNHIYFRLEPDNPVDMHAVTVHSKSGQMLGYVPAFYSWFLYEVIESGNQYEAFIRSFNERAKPQLVLCVDVVGEVEKLTNTFIIKSLYV
ncbi:HIRAN domain-containing protein [Aneurinibacillus migulanus]|uniref:HIRAN domain-containing protein n=1 Tax=Aneurinibacillus migulanus TaxID=47500 RepID=UPI00209E5E14|nr:HIRAN domain-containing protein [Aneurinibacillus migulanus]MCP1359298.1 HIRAN domain-containing protein [Aneurinibacillus migulanus]